jgi:hypothetical protein
MAREIQKYELELVEVPEVRWERGRIEQAENYTFQ